METEITYDTICHAAEQAWAGHELFSTDYDYIAGFKAGVDWLAARLAAMPSARLRAELETLTSNQ
ncbi:MAG: hypothetical protein LIP02_08780 [Bacteroidales bacterium]|nr:hypothetical protein [Bacteroidales bacterium]